MASTRMSLLLVAAATLATSPVADAGRARPSKPIVRPSRPRDGGRVARGSGTPLVHILAAHGRRGRQHRSTRPTPLALEVDAAATAGRVQLLTGLGKDGDPRVAYVAQHPTNYVWRPDVGRLARKVVNLARFKGRIWINTYRDHPPGWGRDTTSFDVWGFGGRGHSLSPADGEAILETLFNDPNKPDIDWIIYRGRMWTRATGQWGPSPPGPPDSDPEHNHHLHVTYL